MDLRQFKSISIGGVELKKLAIDGVEIWRKGYTNWVPKSIDTDGSIYNGGLGYKSGYRIRSGGAEAATSLASCTGFISVKGGDVIRVGGADSNDFLNSSTTAAVNSYDTMFTHLGQVVGNNATGYGIFAGTGTAAAYGRNSIVQADNYWQWTVPPDTFGIAYVRITGRAANGANLIVTINEEIT